MTVPNPSALPEAWYTRLRREARSREEAGRTRTIRAPQGLDFRSNDYLGLRRDPRLAEASSRAAREYGAGSGAARLLGGTTPMHDNLEAALARWKGTEACLLMNAGFQANATLIPALARLGDGVFSDELNHASLVDGCRLAKSHGAQVHVFRHLDLDDLEHHLSAWRQGAPSDALALVVTDTVFSMDGEVVDLTGLLALCQRYDALLLADEAHATGLLGENGAGLAELQGLRGQVPLLMGTLGKALGAFGAYVACSAPLREHLVNACRGFIFSTSLPPPLVGAALEAVDIAQAEPWRRERALSYAQRIRQALGLPRQPSAIVPVVLGAEDRAMHCAQALQVRGFDVRAVRPPAVPEGASRLRITTGAHLEEAQVDALIAALEDIL